MLRRENKFSGGFKKNPHFLSNSDLNMPARQYKAYMLSARDLVKLGIN